MHAPNDRCQRWNIFVPAGMSTVDLNVLVYVNKQARLVVSIGERCGVRLPSHQRKYWWNMFESNPVTFPVGSYHGNQAVMMREEWIST